MIEPSHISESFEFLGNTVHQLWHSCGDTSIDMQWYSKRILLTVIYSSSELYMTQDKSPDFIHTKEFLDKQLDNAMSFGHVSTQVIRDCMFLINIYFFL
jgi:ubiquinone biosynthesis protein COQ9